MMNKKARKILSLAVSLTLLPIVGCGTNTAKKDGLDKSDAVHIKITLTNNKEIEADLYPHIAPKSVENFVNLINQNFFDGLIFHRVIEGFMIQGGGYDESFYEGNFTSKETDTIQGEFTSNGFKNDLKHTRGVLSMARTQAPNSASSQFFIMHQDYPSLDGQYAAFGEVTKGIEVVDEIATGKTTALDGEVLYMGNKYPQKMTDVPETPVVIKTIEIVK
ncbi:MAG TPA: peptidylprolyl isomerase [Clostridiales bacterium]|nr:peptidylprolyl isomerase [Clostridiales bacterium]